MGADKNSSPKRELGLYPKFTTKDSHTSLPRSRSHYGPTNPRNKPQTIPKRKHETRSKGLSSPANTLADSSRPWGVRSTVTGWTVRYPRADGPLIATERPASTQARGRSVPRPRTVREQLVPRGRSATSRRTVDQTPPDQKQLANRIEMKTLKNVRRTLRTPGRTAPREQSACYPQMVRQAREHQPEPETANTKAHIRPWIFQTTEALEVRFGKM
jgi:hypothetical protein